AAALVGDGHGAISASACPGTIGIIGETGGITGATAGATGSGTDGVADIGKPMPRIQLVVIQPTPFCNIDCRSRVAPMPISRPMTASNAWAKNSPRRAKRRLVQPLSCARKTYRAA